VVFYYLFASFVAFTFISTLKKHTRFKDLFVQKQDLFVQRFRLHKQVFAERVFEDFF